MPSEPINNLADAIRVLNRERFQGREWYEDNGRATSGDGRFLTEQEAIRIAERFSADEE